VPLILFVNIFVDVLLVVVALIAVKLVKIAEMAFSNVAKKLVEVEFVRVAFVAVSKLVFITFAAVVPSKLKLVRPFIVVVETMPSTVLVIRFVVDEKLSVFVVVAAMRLARLVVDTLPFTVVVMMAVEVAKDT
jgi:hypothetical protein